MHSLIVDDVFILRKMLSKVLSKFSTCDFAENGDVAITKFEKSLNTNPYDLVCMDIMMPNTDGKKAVEMIRLLEKQNNIQHADRVKIIMITVMSYDSEVTCSAECGCDAYLLKPLDIDKFLKKLEELKLIKN